MYNNQPNPWIHNPQQPYYNDQQNTVQTPVYGQQPQQQYNPGYQYPQQTYPGNMPQYGQQYPNIPAYPNVQPINNIGQNTMPVMPQTPVYGADQMSVQYGNCFSSNQGAGQQNPYQQMPAQQYLLSHPIQQDYPQQVLQYQYTPQANVANFLNKDLIDIVRKSNKIMHKFYNDKQIEVLYKYTKYEKGYIFQYINDSNKYVLDEDLTFTLQNCFIAGVQGNRVRFWLMPKTILYIHIIVYDNGQTFKADVDKLDSKVTLV